MRDRQHIPFSFCTNICQYREAKGTISSIEELMNIKGIRELRLKQICEKLMAEPDLSEKKRKPAAESSQTMKIENHFHPKLILQDLKSLTNVTSVEVCLDSVHYATMTRDLELTQWGHFFFPSSNLYKHPPTDIFLEAMEIVDKLPVSNIYLFESRMYKQASNSNIQFRLFIGQMQMALQTLINKDIKTSGQHKVFYASNTFVSKIFDLVVGGERISGQHIVKKIEDEQYTEQVHIPSHLWKRYRELDLPLSQERYCKCFLLSLAFCQSFLLPLNREEN
ncbi:transcription elongation factor, mitochondrial-like isoform X2 [Physella acuta]|nr:transcription elongation factor, mitochondrial-like isoform X2 [Physella acuta]